MQDAPDLWHVALTESGLDMARWLTGQGGKADPCVRREDLKGQVFGEGSDEFCFRAHVGKPRSWTKYRLVMVRRSGGLTSENRSYATRASRKG
jgi:hypothetical protein